MCEPIPVLCEHAMRVPALLVLATLPLLPTVSVAQSAFDLTVRGTVCDATPPSGALHCIYRIGSDLEFSIADIGHDDATISVLRSNVDGDFFLRIGMVHGCAIVAAGARAPQSATGPATSIALVSPWTGKVVRTWAECDSERLKGKRSSPP